MDKPTLEILVQFCASQHSKFDPKAWNKGNLIEHQLLAVVARYLSMTSWYGYETELEAIAEELVPGVSAMHRLNNGLQALANDILHLSAAIRYRIAVQRTAERSMCEFVSASDNFNSSNAASVLSYSA